MRLTLLVAACCIIAVASAHRRHGGGRHHSRCSDSCPNMNGRVCPHGLIHNDTTGCTVCECAPAPGCDQVRTCRKWCPNGFQTDETTHCPMCECIEPPQINPLSATATLTLTARTGNASSCSPIISCMMECPLGKKRDAQGCELCECLENRNCPTEPRCSNKCAFGYSRDSFGCKTCLCNTRRQRPQRRGGRRQQPGRPQGPPPAPATFSVTGASEPLCPLCGMFCEHGYKTGNNTCPMCECNEAPVTQCAQCHLFCPFGYEADPQHAGCALCQCKTRQAVARPSGGRAAPALMSVATVDCPPFRCRKHCAFGFARDSTTGCHVCSCASTEGN